MGWRFGTLRNLTVAQRLPGPSYAIAARGNGGRSLENHAVAVYMTICLAMLRSDWTERWVWGRNLVRLFCLYEPPADDVPGKHKRKRPYLVAKAINLTSVKGVQCEV